VRRLYGGEAFSRAMTVLPYQSADYSSGTNKGGNSSSTSSSSSSSSIAIPSVSPQSSSSLSSSHTLYYATRGLLFEVHISLPTLFFSSHSYISSLLCLCLCLCLCLSLSYTDRIDVFVLVLVRVYVSCANAIGYTTWSIIINNTVSLQNQIISDH
jgi:hypothetical protein